MDFQVISFVITVITGVVSVVLAVFAIWIGKSSERESRRNFERTQNAMREYNDKTKEVLAEIDKRAAVIEKTVTDSQQQLLDTVTNIVRETAVPTKPDLGEQMAAQFFQVMMTDPAKANDMITALQKFGEMPGNLQAQKPSQLAKSPKALGQRKS